MQTPKNPKPINRVEPRKPECTKTCGALSRLDPRRCTCVQVGVGPKNTTFNPDTGRFDYNPQAIGPKPMDTPPPMKKGGAVVKGSQLRRQASSKGLRTSKKHK